VDKDNKISSGGGDDTNTVESDSGSKVSLVVEMMKSPS
jgi:hypothetical protein